jgi:uncharacterized protein (TIGR03435 family)
MLSFKRNLIFARLLTQCPQEENVVKCLLMLFLTVPLYCQSPAVAYGERLRAFDTVSIRQNKSGERSYGVQSLPNGLKLTNCTVKVFVGFAFGTKSLDFIKGLPGWTETTRFDIMAKLDDDSFAAFQKLSREDATAARMKMMQQILIDRFHFKMHREQKEMPAYALVIDKGGPKLTEADPAKISNPSAEYHPGRASSGDGAFTGQAISMDDLARMLSGRTDRQTINKTNLTGKYDVSLRWTPLRTSEGEMTADPDGARASIFPALREQLGLRLEPTQAPFDTIVVEQIDMPTEN